MSKPVLTAEPITSKAMARSLAMAALALAGLFLVSFISQILPLQLMDPAWEFNTIQALVNNASLPLVAFLCLQLAGHLDPGEAPLMARLRSWQRLAVPIACGFLMLIPLHGLVSYRALKAAQANAMNNMRDAKVGIVKYRETVLGATSARDLQQRLAANPLSPKISDEALKLPLPELQRQILGQANDQYSNYSLKVMAPVTELRRRLVDSTPKVVVSAGLLAAFFASGAKRKNAEGTLLEGVRAKGIALVRGMRRTQTKAALSREKDQSIRKIERNQKAAFQIREKREQQVRKQRQQEIRKQIAQQRRHAEQARKDNRND